MFWRFSGFKSKTFKWDLFNLGHRVSLCLWNTFWGKLGLHCWTVLGAVRRKRSNCLLGTFRSLLFWLINSARNKWIQWWLLAVGDITPSSCGMMMYFQQLCGVRMSDCYCEFSYVLLLILSWAFSSHPVLSQHFWKYCKVSAFANSKISLFSPVCFMIPAWKETDGISSHMS